MRTSANIQAGLSLDALGRSDEAVKRLQEIVAANPKRRRRVERARQPATFGQEIRRRRGDLHQGDRPVGQARAQPTGRLFYFRAICFERTKQWPKAEADFKKALELFPDQPLVLNYLGYSWVDQGVNLDEAFKMLRRAVDLQADRRLCRRQPRLGQFQARPLRRGDARTRKGDRTEAGRSRRQRPSRRRLLADGPQARRAFPVEPCARHGARAGGPAGDPQEDRQRPA